ncbi:MAG: hypothetical protein LQ339_000341 [Xanthoria mediterranea]|nr:MAG: hypothetical protein LQ339_000341 [Xanthoria mediterranea]
MMSAHNSPSDLDRNQYSARSSRASRLWQLAATNAMSPTAEDAVAFGSAGRSTGMHHSVSTPQMQPLSFDDHSGQSSARYTSGPSAFRASGGNNGAKEDHFRLSNISKITEPSYGSPSRFIGKSPNPRDQPAYRPPRPAGLAFGRTGEGTQPDRAGPQSAPAHVKSFEDRVNEEGFRPWNHDDFDDHWQRDHDEVPSSISNSTSRQTSHWDLLEAQLGYPGAQPNGQDQHDTTLATSDAIGEGSASKAIVGRGYDDLFRYMAIDSSGQQFAQVPELERLKSTMVKLRGEGDGLFSIHQSGLDVVRQYMYEQIFDVDDRSSGLSPDNPKGLIDIAGQVMTREALHSQIICFLEDMLEKMVQPPSPQISTAQVEFEGGQIHHPHASLQHAGPIYYANTERQHHKGGYLSADRAPPPDVSRLDRRQHSPPIHGFEALSLAQQQGGAHQAWQGPSIAETSTINRQVHPRDLSATRPGLGHGHQNFPYGPQPLGMVHQQSSGPFQQQLVSPQGVFYNAPYMSPQMGPMGFYPGGQAVAPAGPMVPYGTPFLRVPHHGNPTMPGQFMPNQQMAMNAFQQPWAPGPSYMMQPPPSQWSSVPGYLGSVYGSMNRAQSPLVRNSDSPFLARAGRSVVSEVALMPYRAGSDDMFPHGQQGGSVQFQELTRNGGPTYDQATRAETLPFAENARKAKPAEWGVLRIGNIPYTLTKQEVLGFLGRNAKIITPEYGVAVHIIMDRPTGKTMDCYVEFFSQGDAQAALNKCLMRGSQLRLGERVVDVHMSSQDELLKELFPRAKNCAWEHGRPKITESTEPYNTGFKAFVTNEELLQTVTWADKPHRKCMQRPYECMISTLAKFPWFCVDRYTIKTRDEMFRSTLSLINILMNELSRANEAYTPHISETLLTDLLYAALNVPAFSEQQRWHLRKAASAIGARVRMSPLAEVWPFEVLGRRVGIDEDVVQKYAQILQSHPANTSTDTAFGKWTAISNEALGLQTIGQIGSHEMEMLLSMLSDVLPQSL